MQVDGSQREPGEGARPRGTPPPPLDADHRRVVVAEEWVETSDEVQALVAAGIPVANTMFVRYPDGTRSRVIREPEGSMSEWSSDEDEHEDNDPGGDTTEEDENFPPLMKGRHDFRASDLFPWTELERPAESKDVPNLDQMSLQHMMDPALDMLYDAKTDMFTFFESGDPVWFEGTLPSQAGRPPPADGNPRPGKEMLAADWLEDRTEDGWGYVQVMHSPDYEHPPCGRFGPPRLWKVLQSV